MFARASSTPTPLDPLCQGWQGLVPIAGLQVKTVILRIRQAMRGRSGPANDASARGGRDRPSQTLCDPRSLGRAPRLSLPEMRSYLGRLIEVLYISRLRPNSGSKVCLSAPQGRQQRPDGSPRGHVLWWKSPAILQRQELQVAPVQRYWSTPTLWRPLTHLPPALEHGCSMSSKPVFCQVHTDFSSAP